MNDSAPIVINAPLPPAPYTLVDQTFMSALADAEQAAAKLRVTDAASAAEGARLQTLLTRAGTDLEKERVRLLRPFLDAQTAINNAAKVASSRIALTKGAVNSLLTSYDTAQKALAAQAEAKRLKEAADREKARQDELKRLEDIRRAEQAESDRLVAELLRKQQAEMAKPNYVPPPVVIDLDDDDIPPAPEKSETQRQIEALRHAPVVPSIPIVAPKIGGLVFRQSLRIISTDLAQLPESFVLRQPDLVGLRQTYCTGWKEGAPMPVCPGVVFEVVKTPVSR